MNIVMLLAPFSLGLGVLAVAAFWWSLRAGQYDDPIGDAERILIDDPDDRPDVSAADPPSTPIGKNVGAARH